jgi:hypothetical protein
LGGGVAIFAAVLRLIESAHAESGGDVAGDEGRATWHCSAIAERLRRLAACGKYGKYGKFPASFFGRKSKFGEPVL